MSKYKWVVRELNTVTSKIKQEYLSYDDLFWLHARVCSITDVLYERIDLSQYTGYWHLDSVDNIEKWMQSHDIKATEELLKDFEIVFVRLHKRSPDVGRWREVYASNRLMLRDAIISQCRVAMYLFSEEYIEHARGNEEYTTLLSSYSLIYKAKPTLFISPKEYEDVSRPSKCATRVRVLWEQAQLEHLTWSQVTAKSIFGDSYNPKMLLAYARKVFVRAGGRPIGFDQSGTYCVPLKSKEHLTMPHVYVPDNILGQLLYTDMTFRDTVYATALADMPVGANIALYPKKVCVTAHLFANYVRRMQGDDMYRLILDYIADFFSGPPQTGASDIGLSDVIAIVDNPRFERYNDKAAWKPGTFDYVTVDISLVAHYGKAALEVVRQNQKALANIVMNRIRSTRRMQGRRLLADLLYVKEFQISGRGFVVTALVEFKPGVEKLLQECVDAMELEKKSCKGVQKLSLGS